MKVSIRSDSVIVEGYVNAIERNSKPLMSRIGRFIERICKGAFLHALERREDIHCLVDHEWSRDVGSTKDGNLELTEDNIGLRARAEITDPDTIEDAKNGNLVGWSFGFLDVPDGVESGVDSDTGLPLRKVRDMDLREVSILTKKKTPAYDGTLIMARADDEIEYFGEAFLDDLEIREDSSVDQEVNEEEIREDDQEIDYSYYEDMISEMKERFNSNHDSKTGRFGSGGGGSSSGSGGSGSGGSGGSGSKGGKSGSGSDGGSSKKSSRGGGGGSDKKTADQMTDKEISNAVKTQTKKVEAESTNTVKPFKKEAKVDMADVKDRGGVDGADAKRCVELAEGVYSKASKVEPQITKDVVSTVAGANGKMYGLEFRMKQPTSMAGKIGQDSKDDGVSFEKSAGNIKDAVRYTAILKDNNFTSGYNKIKKDLESKGYVETRCKNFYNMYREGRSAQKAVQCVYKNKDGYAFELQFHTPNSQGAKNLNHPLYKKQREKITSDSEKQRLNQVMTKIGSNVNDPAGVENIKAHG